MGGVAEWSARAARGYHQRGGLKGQYQYDTTAYRQHNHYHSRLTTRFVPARPPVCDTRQPPRGGGELKFPEQGLTSPYSVGLHDCR